MADLIVLARSVTLKGTAGSTYYQAITESVDVSAYDSLDFQISASADNAAGVVIGIITSMQNKVDDIAAGVTNPSWYSIGSATLSSANAGMPISKALSVPQSSSAAPQLRWIRYYVVLTSPTTTVNFSIEGLARRGLRVG